MTAKKRFEFQDSKSSKFWEVTVSGNTLTVCYGKIGTNGQSKDKELDSEAAAQAEAEKLIAGKVKKGYAQVESDGAAQGSSDESAEFVERDSDWLEENEDYCSLEELHVQDILHADGNVSLTAEEFERILTSAEAVIISGNLVVDGALSVDDGQALYVGGDVRCQSFWVGEGFFECMTLEVAQHMTFACDDNQRIESLDIGTLRAPVIMCPHDNAEDLASTVENEFICNDHEDEDYGFNQLMTSHFDVVYAALKAGKTINDEWILANKHLVAAPDEEQPVASESTSSDSFEFGGEQYSIGATEVSAFSSDVVDLSQLAKLTKLEDLNLRDTAVADLGPISELVSLTELHIGTTEVRDIGPLEKLTNLETLFMGDKVSDLSALSGMTKLKFLSFGGPDISDLAPLGNLSQLKEVIFKVSRPADFAPLGMLGGLKKLTLIGSLEGCDLSPLTQLKKLRELDIYDDNFDDSALRKALPKAFC